MRDLIMFILILVILCAVQTAECGTLPVKDSLGKVVTQITDEQYMLEASRSKDLTLPELANYEAACPYGSAVMVPVINEPTVHTLNVDCITYSKSRKSWTTWIWVQADPVEGGWKKESYVFNVKDWQAFTMNGELVIDKSGRVHVIADDDEMQEIERQEELKVRNMFISPVLHTN